MWQGPPYLDWKLDRWKIGVAVILLLLLLVRYINREWVWARVEEGIGDPTLLLSGDLRTPFASDTPEGKTPTTEMVEALAPATAESTVQPPTGVVSAATPEATPTMVVENCRLPWQRSRRLVLCPPLLRKQRRRRSLRLPVLWQQRR